MNGSNALSRVDVVGVGINATHTIIRLPRFPALDSKVELLSAEVKPGGQVASAIVACRRWGLSGLDVEEIGDDAAGKLQVDEMQRGGGDSRWNTTPGAISQSSCILVNELSGERTVPWKRDAQIALRPEDLQRERISDSRALLVDGHDTEAAAQAARWAREEEIPVVGDFDNRYPHVEALLKYVDFVITSKDFPERLTGEKDLLKSLPNIFCTFKCRLTGATVGPLGVFAWDGGKFLPCPGFQVRAVDTTGSSDIFHGALLYGLVRDWNIDEILEFSCAAAALNCTAPGARGGIASLGTIADRRGNGTRSEFAYSHEALVAAFRAATQSMGVQP